MTASMWNERFRGHPLWELVDQARQYVNATSLDELDASERGHWSYLGQVIEHLEARCKTPDTFAVTPAMLNAVHSAVSDWVAHLREVSTGVYQPSQTTPLADSVMDRLASWPPLLQKDYLSAAWRAADSYGDKVAELTDNLSEALAIVQRRAEELQAQENDLAIKIDQEKQRIAEAMAAFNTTSGATVTDFVREKDGEFVEALKTWRQTDAGYRAQAQELLGKLVQHEESAKNTVHSTSAMVVATDYGRYARNKTVAAWMCDVGAAAVGAVGIAAILWYLFTHPDLANQDVGLSLTRLGASLGTLGVATLIGKRGSQHHREARAAKRTELALRQVHPFIANLDPDDQRVIIENITDRVFIRGDLDPAASSKERPAEMSLVQQLEARRARKRQAQAAAAE